MVLRRVSQPVRVDHREGSFNDGGVVAVKMSKCRFFMIAYLGALTHSLFRLRLVGDLHGGGRLSRNVHTGLHGVCRSCNLEC